MNRIVFDDFDFAAGLRAAGGEADQLRFLAAAGADQVEFETVTVRPVQGIQMFDAASVAVIDRAHQFDQRRAGLDTKRTGNVRRGKRGGNPLRRALDLDARSFEQFEQRPVGQFLAAERDADTLRHMRQQIGKRQAIDRADADRTLQQFMLAGAERLGGRTAGPHVGKRQQLHLGAAAHVGEVRQHAGDVGHHPGRLAPGRRHACRHCGVARSDVRAAARPGRGAR